MELKSKFLGIREIKIKRTPATLITPKTGEEKYKTIVFYHGWSSSKENQIFRGSIFALYGFQVLIPQSNYHGSRNTGLNYEDPAVEREYLPRTIMDNIIEAPEILRELVEIYNADPDNLYVSGHSMGAMTAGCLFTFSDLFKGALVFNGTLNLKPVIDEYKSETSTEEVDRIHEFILQIDPINHIEKLKDRKLIMLNGAEDCDVNPKWQREFYEKAREVYEDNSKIIFETFYGTPHVLTTNMMEEGIKLLIN